MIEKIQLINTLYEDLNKCLTTYAIAHTVKDRFTYFGDKNYGKTAIKRRIKYIRQELLNISKMFD